MAIMGLDRDQQACVEALDGVYTVLAGPGSGKTRTLVARYLNLMMHGASAKDILCLTFTAEAAAEMAARSGIADSKNVFRTFHSFVLSVMQEEREQLSFQLKPAIIPVEFEDFELRRNLVQRYPVIRKPDNLKDYISKCKHTGVFPEEALETAQGLERFYAEAYADYERRCRAEGWLDFDSLLQESVKLLETNDAVRAKYKKKYIQVDEAQDTDILQFRLLQLLFAGNIFAVGDENQNIYEWRSATPGTLTEFSRFFPGARKNYLGINYRSTGAIVAFLKKIVPVDNGLASLMRTDNEWGIEPDFMRYRSDFEESAHVLSRVTDAPNTAIIARTNRQLFRFQQACFSKGMKCKILGRKAFWEQNEVKQMLSYAKNGKFPAEYTAPMVLKAVVTEHRLLDKYRWSGNPLDADPADNIESVFKLSMKYSTIGEFLDFIRRLTYGSKSNKTPAITLSTIHQAKGREWPIVFVVGVTEGVLPHAKSNHPEEHRGWFVAASRAAKELHVTCYKNPSMFLNDFKDQIVEYKPEEVVTTISLPKF
jgi:superfamily I DNA/RNA helicase